MEVLDDVDDFTRYIINYHSNLMTRQELITYQLILAEEKAQNSGSTAVQNSFWHLLASDDPQGQELLRDGADAFFRNTRDRILRDHADDLTPNRCPRCGALARTPHARQCPKCFHSWHEAA